MLRLRRDVSWREVDGEVIALDAGLKNYVSTNATGTLIWKALVAGASLEQLVRRIADEFDVDTTRAEHDVRAFLADLEANGLLET